MDEEMWERGQRRGCVQGNRRVSRGKPHKREGYSDRRDGENMVISERRKERFFIQRFISGPEVVLFNAKGLPFNWNPQNDHVEKNEYRKEDPATHNQIVAAGQTCANSNM